MPILFSTKDAENVTISEYTEMKATKKSVLNKLSNVFKIYKPECTKNCKMIYIIEKQILNLKLFCFSK